MLDWVKCLLKLACVLAIVGGVEWVRQHLLFPDVAERERLTLQWSSDAADYLATPNPVRRSAIRQQVTAEAARIGGPCLDFDALEAECPSVVASYCEPGAFTTGAVPHPAASARTAGLPVPR